MIKDQRYRLRCSNHFPFDCKYLLQDISVIGYLHIYSKAMLMNCMPA